MGQTGTRSRTATQALPSYATFSPLDQTNYTWAANTTDPRALQTTSGGIAATWYSNSAFSLDVNITDGKTHQVALYALDWDTYLGGRSETLQVVDATSNAVLDTRSISSFTNGIYLVWNLSGHVRVNVVTNTGNAVLSGIFFSTSATTSSTPGAANFIGFDTATQGNWEGKYGADGYSIPNSTQALPSYATFSPLDQTNYTWAANTTDPRALQTTSGGIAATWYSNSAFSLDVNITDGKTHQVALYALDWDTYLGGRSETLQVVDATSNAVLDTRSISSFTNGIYLVWNLSGHVRVNVVTNTGNAVLSGIFFGGSSASTQSGQGQVCINPTAVNFGNVNIGTTGSQQATILNCGSSVFSILNISISGNGYSIAKPTLPVALPPGQSMTLPVAFQPSATGSVSGAVTIASSVPSASTVVNLGATGVGFAPVITSQPVNQTVVASQSATFSVADTGTSPMTYQWRKNGAAISGATSSTYTTPATTTSDNSSQFTVLISNCVGSTVSNVAALTVNIPTYVLTVNPSTLSFGNVNASTTTSQNVTVLNSGTGNVTLSGLTASGAGFNASGIASGTVLAPGQSASLAITFSPAVSGSVTGTITVGSNATSGGKLISVSGAGTVPATHSVALVWSASSSVVMGYNVYVSTVSGSGYSKLTASPVPATSYVDGGLTVAQMRYYVVTSVDSTGTESAFSSQVSANIP